MSRDVKYFVFDGVSSEHVGMVLQGPPKFSAPTPKLTVVSVPGRNGDLVFPDGSYNNVECEVPCYVLHGQVFDASAAVNNWLSVHTYRRLQFDGDEQAYRMAYVENGAEIASRLRLLNPFGVKFNCKPQRFLVSGDHSFSMSSGNFDNPGMGGVPLVRVVGSGAGTVTINGYAVTINSIDGYVDIDSDTQNAYKGTVNKNSTISCDEFPVLVPGRNTVSLTGSLTSVQITPRWYTL